MRTRNRGFALILVIWALVLLSSLAAGFAFAVRHEVRVATDMEAFVRAESATTAALHATILALGSRDPATRWQPDARIHTIPWPGARINVRVGPEAGQIDINHAPPELLAGLFAQLFPDSDSHSLADAVIDWRDSDDRPRRNGAESEAYARSGFSYGPANTAFRSVDELSQVIGFDGEMVETTRKFLTVYSKQPKVNAISADLVTLSAIPGIKRDTAAEFVASRELALAEDGSLDFTSLHSGRRYLDTRPGGKTLSLDIEVRLDDGLTHREHAVVRLDRARGYTLLARGTRPVDATMDGENQ